MASKGPRSKLDHETRARRQKALEAPREPPRPKTHWDHVLEEMVWLSKDFESERKWKLSQAKKVALRASKSILDQATRGEKKLKEEEQRMRKIALNISKEVKKFWIKIEKLVLYKYQLELEEKKKKALDKQLDFLLGQTERYSTMLAENLVDMPSSSKLALGSSDISRPCYTSKQGNEGSFVITDDAVTQLDNVEADNDYNDQIENHLEDNEHTIEEDEAQITEAERREELDALQAEADLPLEEVLKCYTKNKESREGSPEYCSEFTDPTAKKYQINDNSSDWKIENCHSAIDSAQHHYEQNNGISSLDEQLVIRASELKVSPAPTNFSDMENSLPCSVIEQEDQDYAASDAEEQDDEATLSEEEELAMKENANPLDELKLLQKESEIPMEELLARYRKEGYSDYGITDSESTTSSCEDREETHLDAEHGSMEPMMNGDAVQQGNPAGSSELACAVEEDAVTRDATSDGRESENVIADAAAVARLAQPTGNTFSTTKVRTKFPFLLKHSLREYQHIGLDWLVTMYEKRLNGILADEMGLGKTIMTIALLAHLACEKGIWGPHLIVVPTSVMLNWETEFLKWCPAFKILTYFGSAKERKQKRQGWMKPNSFHVCITTYRLVIQDSKVFKRKKWKYLILDEAHLIKNWKSQRWQTLLNFNSKRRILLTGTPLQNDLMELWSLMHFLMPHIFQSHQQFKDWFCNPIAGMVDGQEKVNKEVIDRLHNVLRPFILRRLKRDVEKQLPKKHEHVIYCRLSRRQRNLYEDFIASSETQATLASANFFGMISIIMQLRKVCNHPDLFEGRPIISSFDMAGIDMQLSSSVCTTLASSPFSKLDLKGMNFVFTQYEFNITSWEADEIAAIACPPSLVDCGSKAEMICFNKYDQRRRIHGYNIFEEIQKALWEERTKQSEEREASIAWWNSLRCQKKPVYGADLRELVTIKHPVFDILEKKNQPYCYMEYSSRLADIILSPVEHLQKILDVVESFMFAIPASRAPTPVCWCSKGSSSAFVDPTYREKCMEIFSPLLSPIRPAIVRRQVYFPDRRLIQFDCGKLQELALLLRRLKSAGHRALIFTQMTKMLDILEEFINLYGYTYLRLDGSTQPEERQTLMQRFNTNPKFFLFILSTRSGGVGINLVGADTVIFYDSDWNPAMDQQAQDRCHRIGQTREVHIYRLISESTIEENILKKANQKRALDDLVIQSGSYNTEFFKKLDPMELFSGHGSLSIGNLSKEIPVAAECTSNEIELSLSNVDVEAAIKHAEDEADYMALKRVEQEEAVENQEFTEEAIGRLDNDDLGNEDDMKPDEKIAEEQRSYSSVVGRDETANVSLSTLNEEKAIALAGADEELDMIADVKQMAAAAAAAGQASSTFENLLRPIDRYAMRIMDLWDPIVDKSAMEYQVNIDEEEWELDRIEKLKEDLEAEIDEDQEPLLYERWDADFATAAYRQRVEALAQQQLMEEQEFEAEKAEEATDVGDNNRDGTMVQRKPKLKKHKKTKFKSLKKGSLASESDVVLEESLVDPMVDDYMVLSPQVTYYESPTHSSPKKKRKWSTTALDEENNSIKSSKKLKKTSKCNPVLEYRSSLKQMSNAKETRAVDAANGIDPKAIAKIKAEGRISITCMPVKHIMVVKPERLKKRNHTWSKDCSPDSWSPLEDAMLCAAVHEYGTNWGLASEILYGTQAGGFYRGRFHHPVHCCDRFRELFFKYALSSQESSNIEKVSSGSGKALLKVTEEQVHNLLNMISELPDSELLLQKHFVAILSSVWRSKCRREVRQTMSSLCSSRPLSFSSEMKSCRPTGSVVMMNRPNCKLVMIALADAQMECQEEIVLSPCELEAYPDQLELLLVFLKDQADNDIGFPSAVNVSIPGLEPRQQTMESNRQFLLTESSYRIAENRFRLASEACVEGEGSLWASLSFPTCGSRHRSGSRSQSLGKHKSILDSVRQPKPKVQRITEGLDGLSAVSRPLFPSPNQTSPSISSLRVHNMLDCDDYLLQSYADAFPEETEANVYFTHDYDPTFLAGLESLESFSDFTDIG